MARHFSASHSPRPTRSALPAPLLGAFAALAGLYALVNIGLPYLLVQLLNWGVVREGRRGAAYRPDQVALTFDDGPDPQHTPHILAMLREHGAKATFFLLTPKAAQYPELVQQIIDEGHEIGAHAVRHVHSWRRTPADAYRDTVQSVSRLRRQTGQVVRFHRPPHGSYTLATILAQRAIGAMGAHWSVNGNEWQAGMSAADCLRHMLYELQAGSVLVLHDAGNYAHKTRELLPELLSTLTQRGYQCCRLSDLSGAEPLQARTWPRRFLISLDRQFDRWQGIHPAGGQRNNLFRLQRVSFSQPDQVLASGAVVAHGAPAAEFHVNNPRLIDLGNKAAVRRARQDLREVAAWLQRPEQADLEVIYCLSALGPLLRLLHFENYPLPEHSPQTRRLCHWARVLRWGYSGSRSQPKPTLSILSRESFLRRYG